MNNRRASCVEQVGLSSVEQCAIPSARKRTREKSMNTSIAFAALLSAALCPILLSAPASAGIADCGNIDVQADAKCTATTGVNCEATCTPVSFEAACAGKLETSCSGQCNATATAACTGSCETDCQAECKLDPPSFDCSANCKLDAQASCQGQCSAAANKGECEASCKATFSGQCDAKCQGTPGTADCSAKCQARCNGSCSAEVNAKCQIDCQSTGYASCKTEMSGGCRGHCSTADGALFCDGNYVDDGGHFASCVAAIRALLPTVTITTSSSGSSSCTGNSCQAEGEANAKATCAVAQVGAPATGGLGILLALGAIVGLRRRRG
jgi:hypothetical protein